MSSKFSLLLGIAALGLSLHAADAQSAPASPATPAPAPSAPGQAAPAAPAPSPSTAAPAPAGPTFRPPDPTNFTADSPSVATVNSFLKQLWGYDTKRIWQVQGIQKTLAPGVSRVTVYVANEGDEPNKVQGSQFFVLPDGKHAIADDIFSFGPQPFADLRDTLRTRANGPAKGAAGKDFLFVEFSDFQCPHCKDAQPIIDHLMQDFPNARFVFQTFPLRNIHPAAEQAAEYGVCVSKTSNDAFFKYANAVFEDQAALTPQGATDALKAAVTKAGLQPDQVAACAALPQTKSTVDESVKLASDINVSQTPTLYVNGRSVPLSPQVPYETLRNIVAFQAQLDGQPGPKPSLTSLSK